MKATKKLLSKFANKIEEHISIGNLTIYGDNAMHFGCQYWTKRWGYICFRLPLFCGLADKINYSGHKLYWRPLYFYVSRNATPWAAVFFIGKNHSKRDWALARARKHVFGWNYNTDDEHQYERLMQINHSL